MTKFKKSSQHFLIRHQLITIVVILQRPDSFIHISSLIIIASTNSIDITVSFDSSTNKVSAAKRKIKNY